MISSVVSLCCVLLLLLLMVSHELPDDNERPPFASLLADGNGSHEVLGKLGRMLVDMLPNDLAFTVFAHEGGALERDLHLHGNGSLDGGEWDDTHAVLSRVLGYSCIPRVILSVSVPGGGEVSFDSVSGYQLTVSVEMGGVMKVNGIPLLHVDPKNRMIIHVLKGVLMDSDFRQSFNS